MLKEVTIEEASFIKEFLTSSDFKRFCRVYFDYRSDTVNKLCTIPVKTPTYAQELALQQGILVGMDMFAKVLLDCESIIATSKRKEREITDDEKA